MENIFIKKIKINKVRHLENINIKLSETERKHLILTGKNGSGKTSLLNEIRYYFKDIDSRLLNIANQEKQLGNLNKYLDKYRNDLKITVDDKERAGIRRNIISYEESIKYVKESINNNIDLSIENLEFTSEYSKAGNFITTFFEAKRKIQLKTPNGIQKLDLQETYRIEEKANIDFIQYLVNLKAQRSFARDDNKMDVVKDIDEWFTIFEDFLKEVFDNKEIKLEFDSQNFNFNIILPDREKFDFNTLSDGYASIMNIVTELILRMEKNSAKNYNIQGVVLIDEIETHLHIDLQKKILPFLTKIFPKIQFIVSTHSPFIINSLENAVVYDLENHIQVEDLSGYSVEGIIEGYFKADKYSIHLKNLVAEYEKLVQTENRNKEEKERFKELRKYFKDLSKFMSPELQLKIQQLEFINIEKA